MKRLLLLGSLLACLGCSSDHQIAPKTPATTAATASNRLAFENVMRLHDGQRYADVVEIMGGQPNAVELWKANRLSQFSPQRQGVQARWGAEGGPRITVTFLDGLVGQLEMKGIEPPPGTAASGNSPD